MIRPGTSWIHFLYIFYILLRKFYILSEKDSGTSCTEDDTPGMGQWECRPKADPDPAKNQPVCPGPNSERARTYWLPACRVGWAPCWVIGRLEALPRQISCGPARPSISSAFQPHQELRIFGPFLPFFFFKKKRSMIYFFSVSLFFGCGPLVYLCAYKKCLLPCHAF